MAQELFKMEDINACAEENRRFAYTQETDPLFMQVQRGEVTQEEWQAKINEIKARFPYVTEDVLMEVPDVIQDEAQLAEQENI